MPPRPTDGPRDLLAAVKSLRDLAPRLNELTDSASEVVREVEDFLNNQISIGIDQYCLVDDLGEGAGERYLAYIRVNQRYRIAVVVADSDGKDQEVRAWAESPRDEKLDTFHFLPELLKCLAVRVEEEIAKIEKTAKSVRDTIAALRDPTPPPPTPPAPPLKVHTFKDLAGAVGANQASPAANPAVNTSATKAPHPTPKPTKTGNQ